jgi:DNA-directed RNA polymerase specialized sigma24 family protein
MSSPLPGPEWVLPASQLERDGNQELQECARNAWPRALAYARHHASGRRSNDERDSLAAEVWEGVLRSVSATLERTRGVRRKIEDLESYLIGAFQHRLNRALTRERRRERTFVLVSPYELDQRADRRGIDWTKGLEHHVQLQEILEQMDDWTRVAWALRQYGYSWRQVADQFGMKAPTAKMRFRYALGKIRQRLTGISAQRYPAKEKDEGGGW